MVAGLVLVCRSMKDLGARFRFRFFFAASSLPGSLNGPGFEGFRFTVPKLGFFEACCWEGLRSVGSFIGLQIVHPWVSCVSRPLGEGKSMHQHN